MARKPNRKQRREMLDEVLQYARKNRAEVRRTGGAGGLWRGLADYVARMFTGRKPNRREVQQAEEVLREAGYQPTTAGDVVLPGPGQRVVQREEDWPEEHGLVLAPRGHGDLVPPVQGERKKGFEEVFTPGSSNVYSYRYVPETPTMGILYVTFQIWIPGQKGKRYGQGPTYAYYDVPLSKYLSFNRNPSAGKAVWDYLRVRGSVWRHQHPYRLARGTIGANIMGRGKHEYVPRKATREGFKVRTVPTVRQGRFGVGTRSQLPERRFSTRRD